MMNVKGLLAVALFFLCASGARAQATLIVSDGFQDTPGAITGKYGGYGWQYGHDWTSSSTTNPDQVTAGGLSFSINGATLAVSGNKLTTVGSDVGAYRRPPTDLGDYGGDVNQELWIGFLASNTTGSMTGSYAGLSLFDTTEQFFVGVPQGTNGYGIQNDSVAGPDGQPQVLDPAFLSADQTTHFIVAHFSFSASGTTEVSLYVDPTPGVATDDGYGDGLLVPTQDAAVDKVYTQSFQFNELRFQSGSDTHAYNFDELRMGNTYLDVAPLASPVAAPEPGPVATLLVGMGVLACRLRRKKGAAV